MTCSFRFGLPLLSGLLIPLLGTSIGCSDYNIEKIQSPAVAGNPLVEAPTFPQIVVDPLSVTHEDLCMPQVETITILNNGEGPLTIDSIDLYASGWYMTQPSLPLVLEHKETYTMTVMAEDGAGILEIQSDDPTNPHVWIELNATPDNPPTLAITAPFNGAIVPIEGQILEGRIEDDVDHPEDFIITWESDIDGIIGTSIPRPDGTFSIEFAEGSPGDHEISVYTQDSCANEADFPLRVCQQFGYDVENLDISTWNFVGDAFWDAQNNWVQLTPVDTYRVGTAFSTAIPVNGGNVEIEFQFYIGEGTGADGISLTALDIDRMTSFLGGTGCGIGYGGHAACTGGPALPGWSIEVDTYFNPNQDPTPADHIAFTFDGDVDGPEYWSSLPEMEDTGWHTMRVVVAEPHVLVQIDGITYMDQDVSGHFDFPAYIGFTAGTGGSTNKHLIDSLVVTETVCADE